ncbi:MAG: HAD hydrolase-like protein [FCB group bacterium]|nr:HAD hydrolase-like protein [FCB group bacterium]
MKAGTAADVSSSPAKFADYRHIIWDWNGTLFDDAWLCLESMNKVLARRNMPPLTRERYVEIFEFPVINYYRKLGFDFEQEPFEISGSEFIREYNARHHLPGLQEGAREILQVMVDRGLTQSLLSAQQQETLDELIDHREIRSFFTGIIGLDNHYAYSKVKRGQAWMAALPCTPAEVLFVGDTLHDAEVAASLGCDCVLIPGGHQSPARLARAGVPVLSALREVEEVV